MLRGVAETLWSARSDDELIGVVEQAQRLASVLAAVEASAVAEADLRGLAKERLHYGSTGDWLTHTGGLRRGEGKRRVVRAHALTGPLTRTRSALVAGEVSATQVDPILDAVHALPSGELVRARGEQAMLEHAARAWMPPSWPGWAGTWPTWSTPTPADRRLEAALDREDRAAHAGRFLAITEDRAGGVRIKGYGSTEDAALLKAALLPLTCPSPGRRRRGRVGWGDAGSPGPRRPALGRPDRHRPPRPHHRACRRRPTPPHPGCWSPSTTRPSSTQLWRPRDRHHRGRRRTLTRDRAQVGLRRRDHPRRPRQPRRGPRHRPHPTPGHRRPLDRPRPQGPALHLPRLHPTPGDVPRPPPHPLGRRR